MQFLPGELNRHLSGALAELGHGDGVLVCDAGMPIPAGPRVVDLAFRAGVPSFAEVLDGLLAELVVEGGTAAAEVRGANPATAELLNTRLPALRLVSHEELKELSADARLVVRTGEAPAVRERAPPVRGVLLTSAEKNTESRTTLSRPRGSYLASGLLEGDLGGSRGF
ncbi:D-ribose pyranase [Streptomyces canus]